MNSRVRTLLKRTAAGAAMMTGLTALKRKTNGLVILMFHKVNDEFDPLPLTLSVPLFARMLEEIADANHEFVRLDDWIGNRSTQATGGLQFAVTFDDGYRDNYTHAFPILSERNIPATIYLSVDHVNQERFFWHETLTAAIIGARRDSLDLSAEGLGRYDLGSEARRHECLATLNLSLKSLSEVDRQTLVERIASQLDLNREAAGRDMLTWEMINEMAAQNIRFGSHTMSHPILSRESAERVQTELVDSKLAIENQIGDRIDDFAYPNGTADDFNDSIVEQVRETGYRSACTTITGINDRATNPFLLKRVNIHNGMCTTDDGKFDRNLFWAKALQLF